MARPNKKLRKTYSGLLNLRELSEAQETSYQFFKDAKRAGMVLPGNRISMAAARAWMDAHPDFRETARQERARSPWRHRR